MLPAGAQDRLARLEERVEVLESSTTLIYNTLKKVLRRFRGMAANAPREKQ